MVTVRRLVSFAAAALLVCALAPGALAAGGTTIDTVAGGGSDVGLNLVPATSTHLNGPTGLARLGSGGEFALMPDKDQCVIDHVVPDAGSDTGVIYLDAGTGSCTSSANPFDGTQFALNTPLASPCCVSQWSSSDSILIANSDVGRIEGMDYHDYLYVTYVGSTQGCAGAPPDNVARASVHLCRITALAAHPTDQTRLLFAETGRTDGGGDEVYELSGGNVHHVAGGGCTTASATPAFNLCLLSVSGLTYSAAGTSFLVSDYASNDVIAVSGFNPASASVSKFAGGSGSPSYGFSGDGGPAASAKLNHPFGISATYDGGYLISDGGNCRIREVDAAGTISTIAGVGCTTAPLGDGGAASAASLAGPQDVVMTAAGALVADTGNNRIRLINRTTILSGPPALTSSPTPSFSFASMDATPALDCALDGGAPFACPSPFTLAATGDGRHDLAVWESNPPADPTPAHWSFTVDATAPSGLSLSAPADGASTTTASPTFTWHAASDATTAVAGYELVVDGTKVADVAPAACAADQCSLASPSALANGAHTWTVRARDTAGNVAQPDAAHFAVASPPTASFAIAPNPAGVGRPVTFDATSSAGPTAITRYEWDLNGDGSFETDRGSNPVATASYPVAGSYNVTLRVTDAAGLQSTSTQTARISTLSTNAVQFGVTIDRAAKYTNDPNVTLTLVFPALTSSVLVSNDGGFGDPSTFLPTQQVRWKLDSTGPERLPKTVYVRYLPSLVAGLTFTDDIILDERPPVVQQAVLAPTAGLRGAAARAARLRAYRVRVKATDTNSGVGRVQVASSKRHPGKLLRYKRKLTVKSAERPKFIRARDRAGNFSRWKKLR